MVQITATVGAAPHRSSSIAAPQTPSKIGAGQQPVEPAAHASQPVKGTAHHVTRSITRMLVKESKVTTVGLATHAGARMHPTCFMLPGVVKGHASSRTASAATAFQQAALQVHACCMLTQPCLVRSRMGTAPVGRAVLCDLSGSSCALLLTGVTVHLQCAGLQQICIRQADASGTSPTRKQSGSPAGHEKTSGTECAQLVSGRICICIDTSEQCALMTRHARPALCFVLAYCHRHVSYIC